MCEIRKCALNKGVETCGSCAKLTACSTVCGVLENSAEAAANLNHIR